MGETIVSRSASRLEEIGQVIAVVDSRVSNLTAGAVLEILYPDGTSLSGLLLEPGEFSSMVLVL